VVVSIDSFMGAHAIQSVDFMKMDIEGHELFALRGAARALARGAIRAMSFEFGSGNINSRTFFRDYWDLLTRHGYEIYRVLPRGRTLRIFRYDEDLEYFRGVSNYVAVWRNVTAPARARAPAFPGWSWQSGRRGSPTKVGKARA
jgi:hypothetical protein